MNAPRYDVLVAKPAFTAEQVSLHNQMLAEKVFQVESKWPQFGLLLRDCARLARELAKGSTIVCMERTLLYGGISLFAPLFQEHDFVSLDCSPGSAGGRGAYNKSMVDDPRCLVVESSARGRPEATGLPGGFADLVMLPNLVHHVADQEGMFSEVARLLKPGARGYIFEPLIRELHQAPDDFLRYTPFGLQRMVERAGLEFSGCETTGGPFTAIAYCWAQALEYLPDDKRAEMERWFYGIHFPQLRKWEEENPVNLKREHTSFPTACAVAFTKPAR